VLVLVSFGLVLLATILLVVGLLTDDGLALIYLSIASSFTAAVVLFLAFRRARPKQDAPSEAPAPLLPEGEEPEDATTIQPAVAEPEAEGAALVNPGATPTADTEAAATPEIDAEDELTDESASDDWTDDDDWADAGEFEVEFPIADYDDLTVAEIMPLLPQLYSDELEVVAERERAGQNRATILSRLDELAATGTDADEADELEEEEVAAPAAPAAAPSRPAPSRPAPQVPSLSDDDWDDDEVFPIADYDELSVDQIVPLLSQLEDDELEDVKAREVAGQGRKTVITEIDRQLGLVDAVDDDGWRDAARADADVEPVPADGAVPDGRPAPVAASAESSVLAISGYDGLTVAEIRPLLAGLSDTELRAVLAHETARDNRRTIVSEIERRLDSDAAREPVAAPARATATATKKRAAKKATARKATVKKATATRNPATTSKKKAVGRTKKAAAPRFPIDGYDELTVAEIRPRLADLSAAQLRQVRDREQRGAGRKTILSDIDKRL
jgi:hypothetical protein